MKAYVIVNVAIRDPERYKDYIKAATPTVAAHGGQYIASGRRSSSRAAPRFNRIVVLDSRATRRRRVVRVA
jgi:uncharacterized protein (DUF1330 family)